MSDQENQKEQNIFGKDKDDIGQITEERIEDIPAYMSALKAFDRQYHQFEHNFGLNVNRYPQNLSDDNKEINNAPAHSDAKDLTQPLDSSNKNVENLNFSNQPDNQDLTKQLKQ